ncbi:hypothetical protein K4H28_01795 [Deefgea tanakiae]|uniref:Phage protein n=1 Tax=Deefgea tanakiae TaxID=2865840 RepID=A0ABX8Z6I7_9NEIS|nr:hypothetical protein [Deefgea tanakiae]QZA78183.1 hypothetical protein K4H28_01795 [Deefgea tanakiae]
MAVNIKVKGDALNKNLELDFDWDIETGEISGKDAEHAKFYLKNFGGKRLVKVYPDWSIPCPPPYKSLEGMAGALFTFFDLPDWLAEHLTPIPDDDDEDGDFIEEVIY